MEGLLGEYTQVIEPGAPARQDKSGRDVAVKPGTLQIVANQRKELHGARLDDVRQQVREDGAGRTVADAGNLDGAVSLHEGGSRAAVAALEPFGFRDRCAQADAEILCEVVAANSNGAGVAHHAAAKHKQFRGAAADIQQTAAEIALVLREAGFG